MRRGVSAPSEAKFESWINKDLIRGANAKGRKRGLPPDWSYGEQTLKAACEILRLESLGATRAAQLRVGLGVAGYPVDLDKIRDDLASECTRSLKRMTRMGWRNFIGINSNANPTIRDLRRVTEISPVLRNTGIVPTDEDLLQLVSSALTGTSENPGVPNFFQGYFDQMLFSLLPANMQDHNVRKLADDLLSDLFGILRNVSNSPDWQALMVGVFTITSPIWCEIFGPDFDRLFVGSRV
jgi:hypothetical protein